MAINIKVRIPTSSTEFKDSQIEERKKAAAPGSEVEVICLAHGPVSIEAAYDEALAGPYIIEEVKKAEKEGFDAVSLDCAMDTVVRAAREAVNIPVTSAGESSYLLALGLCSKFSVVTVLKSTADAIKENIRKYGFETRVASIRYADIAVLDLQDEKKAFDAILKEAKMAIEREGAEAIVLGCTGMSSLTQRLQKTLGVPVIDPAVASLKLAEIYVNMGLTSSKIAYESPSEKRIL
ncbi:MAG: aspartate/glutamate racemase family protein [Candidatus Aerophobus sp.]|nr:MAG: aspartate/glutamate racemase family protein [Candidatus Aerophobus sp.]